MKASEGPCQRHCCSLHVTSRIPVTLHAHIIRSTVSKNEFVQQDRPAQLRGGPLLGETHPKEQGRRNKTGAFQTVHLRPIRLRQMLETDVLPSETRQRSSADGSAPTRTEDARPGQSDQQTRGVESMVVEKRATTVQNERETHEVDKLGTLA